HTSLGHPSLTPTGRTTDLIHHGADGEVARGRIGRDGPVPHNREIVVASAAGAGNATAGVGRVVHVTREGGVTPPAPAPGRTHATCGIGGIRHFGGDLGGGRASEWLPVRSALHAALCGGAMRRGHESGLAASGRVEPNRAEKAGEVDLETGHDGAN